MDLLICVCVDFANVCIPVVVKQWNVEIDNLVSK